MKKYLIFISGFLFAIIIVVVVGWGFLNNNTTISSGKEKKIDNEDFNINVDNIKVVELTSNDFVLIQKETKVKTLINFWASWCEPCIDEMPILVEYCKKNRIRLMLISTDKNNEKQKALIKKQLHKFNLNETYIIKNQEFGDMTGRNSYYSFMNDIKIEYDKNNTGIPFFILLDKNGKVQNTFNGPQKDFLYTSYYNSKINY